MTTSRSHVTTALKEASTSYWLKKGYSCYLEIAVMPWGKMRADMLGLNMKADLVLCEVKSSLADYRTDKKWENYIAYADRMFFVFTEELYAKLYEEYAEFKRLGVGVLVLSKTTGYLECKIQAKRRKIEGKVRKNIIVRMAFRHGISRRKNRRKRVFV